MSGSPSTARRFSTCRALTRQPQFPAVPIRPSADVALDSGARSRGWLLEGGVLPVMKHIPGHGRAVVDSHYDLPVIKASPRRA